jgi:hypothetical protein
VISAAYRNITLSRFYWFPCNKKAKHVMDSFLLSKIKNKIFFFVFTHPIVTSQDQWTNIPRAHHTQITSTHNTSTHQDINSHQYLQRVNLTSAFTEKKHSKFFLDSFPTKAEKVLEFVSWKVGTLRPVVFRFRKFTTPLKPMCMSAHRRFTLLPFNRQAINCCR